MPITPTGAANRRCPRTTRPPRDDLVRAQPAGVEHARRRRAGGMPTLFGHFAVFNRWTEIDSFWEGHFLERIASRRVQEDVPRAAAEGALPARHGPAGRRQAVRRAPETLSEDDQGAYYEVPLLDTSYNRDLDPGLRPACTARAFRFSVMREEWVDEPGVSERQPEGPAGAHAQGGPRQRVRARHLPGLRGRDRRRAVADRRVHHRPRRPPARAPARLLDYLESATAPQRRFPRHPAAGGRRGHEYRTPRGSRRRKRHPADGRRNTTTGLYGLPPKEKSWRL
jgi:hypothetical protein